MSQDVNDANPHSTHRRFRRASLARHRRRYWLGQPQRTQSNSSLRSAAWGKRLWRQPLRYGLAALALLAVLAVPVFALKTAMPSIKVVPTQDNSRQGYDAVQRAFGPGWTGPIQIVLMLVNSRMP